MKLGTVAQGSTSVSAIARRARLRHQQLILSSAEGNQSSYQSYALMHVTGFFKNATTAVESLRAVNEDCHRTATDFVVSLLGTKFLFNYQML